MTPFKNFSIIFELMSKSDIENRKDTRFEEIGRVNCEELCGVNGILDDISLKGCKVHFPSKLDVDMENDYFLKIRLTRLDKSVEFTVKGLPQWIKEDKEFTYVGFKILTSPDTPKLLDCIEQIKHKNDDDVELSDLLIDSSIDYI